MKVAFLGNFGVSFSSESHHAASLETLGHEVIRLQEPQVDGSQILNAARTCDLFVWVHTHGWNIAGMDEVLRQLRAVNVPSMTYHLDLWMGLQRQQDMQTDPYWQIDHFFTADKKMAEHLTHNTPVKGHYLPAGVYDKECYMAEPRDPFDVAFIGSKGYHPEWPYRPQLIDWLHATYGDRFRHYGGGGKPAIRESALNQVYADAKVVVGDTLCLGFDYPDYFSDRAFETLGRGGFMIHPHVPGLENIFDDGKHMVFYSFGDFDQLKWLIDYYLDEAHADERETIRQAGHQHVRANHTYRHRWQTILKVLSA